MGILTGASALNEAVSNKRQHSVAVKKVKRLQIPSPEATLAVEPARRSSRLRGEAPAVQCYGTTENHRFAARLVSAAMQSSDADDCTHVDAHNLYRIKTMSESALQRRIYTIRRCDKLQSYVQLLKACGMEELAKHAQQRLTELFALSAVLTQEASKDLKPAEERTRGRSGTATPEARCGADDSCVKVEALTV
ncbi:g2252 [Coccomyxa viridis]|uniref:G2252 protein n=1 Tax=Coccomyxa viridis TaxID=1274662 RepID=A0ABP1FLK5_9CHLO